MKKDRIVAALLYIGIFAGIPLAIIVALFLLPVLNFVDPTAIVILVIFSIVLVALWIFVPYEKPIGRRRSAKERTAAKRVVPAPSEASARATGDKERREPFVEAVERSTHRPAAQPQVRLKAKSGRKKSSKKKKR